MSLKKLFILEVFLIRNSSVVYYLTCDAQVRLSDALLFYFLSHLLPSRWAESAVGAGKVFGRAEDGQSCFVSGGITPTCTAQQTVKEKKHSKNSFFSLRSFHVFLEFFFIFLSRSETSPRMTDALIPNGINDSGGTLSYFRKVSFVTEGPSSNRALLFPQILRRIYSNI